jgi:hypothetical protein
MNRSTPQYAWIKPHSTISKVEGFFISHNKHHWTYSLVVWVLANLADCLITWQALSIGGYEANLFLRLAEQTYGDHYLYITKMSLALLLGIFVWGRVHWRVKGFLNLGMSMVVIANCTLLFQPIWQTTML